METIKYSQQVVTLIDILGFKNVIMKTSPENILEYYETLRNVGGFETLRKIFGAESKLFETEQKFLNFSDTCVRTTPLVQSDGRTNDFGILWHELMAVAHLQADMIWKHNILLRGAITIGNVFNNGQELFGPAIVAAYELESTVAIYPRVIVDPIMWAHYKTNPLLRKRDHDYDTDKEYVEKTVTRGDDGVWFVDYMTTMAGEVDDANEFSSLLVEHKKMILAGTCGDTLNRQNAKYSWLAKYHNQVVNKFPAEVFAEYGVDIKTLVITKKELPTLGDL